jgi:Flp pilus assembly CpaF family ATPase
MGADGRHGVLRALDDVVAGQDDDAVTGEGQGGGPLGVLLALATGHVGSVAVELDDEAGTGPQRRARATMGG